MSGGRYSVLVLMSTYNGERFIKEQLNSILSQDNVEVFLLVRDDGSRDSTCKILAEYAYKYDRIDYVTADNVGFVKSFSLLVEMALDYKIQPDFYAFSDQDDVWFPNKLELACEMLSTKDNSLPNLFTSNSMQIDASGKELGLFHASDFMGIRKGNALIFGTEQGCSMVFNKRAASLYVDNEPSLCWHDRWLYHICYYLGNVIYYTEPLFYYRLHGGNVLGKQNEERRDGLFRRVKDSLRFYFSNSHVTNHYEMAREFYSCFNSRLSEHDKLLCERYISYRSNLLSKVYILFSKEFCYPYNNLYDAILSYRRLLLFNKL